MAKEKSKTELYLERIEKIDIVVHNKLIERQQWADLALSITANMDGERVQSSGSLSKMADALNKCMDMEAEIDSAVEKLVAEKREIVSVIEQVDSPTCYNVLHLRYVQYKEPKEIAEHYGREYNWATTTLGRARANVREILDKKEGRA